MSGPDLYAQVILPLAVEGTYTYSVPDELADKISPGSRVLVSFGKKRIYIAIIHSLNTTPPDGFTPKSIIDVMDEKPLVTQQQLQLWEWMSSYYMCTLGEVMRATLPSGLRPESESRVRISAGYNGVGPRIVTYVRLSNKYTSEESLHLLLDQLVRAPRQREMIEKYLQLTGTDDIGSGTEVLKREMLKPSGASGAIGALIKKGVLEQVNREELRHQGQPDQGHSRDPFELNGEQSVAIGVIREQFNKHQSVLLHGVTSSGKTELYIHLIREVLEKGRQVLYLLPEIALTTQIIERMRQVFGKQVGVYHSRYSDSERVHVYRNLLGLTDDETYRVIIGVRSAIFLPFDKLGLVIIDEEHETTFKQHDPAPRYHARDSAQVLALYHDAKVLLGTATPSFESLFNARNGKFGFASIQSRFGEVAPPEIILADTRIATKRKQMVSHFTPRLMEGIKGALENGEQVILFQNRRGYSNYIVCNDCGHIPKCKRCDVSLTFHRYSRKLECHYCGHKEVMPRVCPSCAGTNMTMKGFGTEKIEDEIALVFEGIRVGRLDTDTARSVRGYEKIIRSFEEGQLDVLIGTQMLSKGLDFDNVSLVGVLDADSMLHFPDFRAFERTFQLISQVSGRAGRRKKRGKVIIQTMDPGHPVIRYIVNNDFEGLFREQMEERQVFGYPPFKRMIRISFRHKIPSILDGATDLAGKELKTIFSSRVYGPQYPPVRKVHNTFIKQIILKIEREASYERARELIKEVLDKISKNEVYRSIRISIDVDPF
ncbi:MAG: primosomal protein N' [Bacteroidales bacterium]|nr:primosomal protein N' [Bacteroidales bacterium]